MKPFTFLKAYTSSFFFNTRIDGSGLRTHITKPNIKLKKNFNQNKNQFGWKLAHAHYRINQNCVYSVECSLYLNIYQFELTNNHKKVNSNWSSANIVYTIKCVLGTILKNRRPSWKMKILFVTRFFIVSNMIKKHHTKFGACITKWTILPGFRSTKSFNCTDVENIIFVRIPTLIVICVWTWHRCRPGRVDSFHRKIGAFVLIMLQF